MAADLEAALEALAPDLLGYLTRRTTHPQDAADLLQDTFVVLCRRADDLPEDPREQRMWAFGIARRVLAGQWRSTRRRSALVERLRLELRSTEPPASTPTLDRLHESLATLDEEDREIIRLVHWEGFTLAEVARVLDCPAGTVRSRWSRARASLREDLSRHELSRHELSQQEPTWQELSHDEVVRCRTAS